MLNIKNLIFLKIEEMRLKFIKLSDLFKELKISKLIVN